MPKDLPATIKTAPRNGVIHRLMAAEPARRQWGARLREWRDALTAGAASRDEKLAFDRALRTYRQQCSVGTPDAHGLCPPPAP